MHTLRDVLHAVTSSLSVISGHAQHLLSRPSAPAGASAQLGIIRSEAERSAHLLALVPDDLAQSSIGLPDPEAPEAQGRGGETQSGGGDEQHGK
ncbi:MAG: hypothetical protein HY744_25415 [Deltaproteobacteria bacterium]|nr:hypothetical protein [Deltaproteobacteria bacterium]